MGGVSPSHIGFERAARTHKMTHLTFILFFGLLLFSRHLSQRRRRTKPTPRLQEPKTVAATILVSLCEFTCVCVCVRRCICSSCASSPSQPPHRKGKNKKKKAQCSRGGATTNRHRHHQRGRREQRRRRPPASLVPPHTHKTINSLGSDFRPDRPFNCTLGQIDQTLHTPRSKRHGNKNKQKQKKSTSKRNRLSREEADNYQKRNGAGVEGCGRYVYNILDPSSHTHLPAPFFAFLLYRPYERAGP